MKTIAQLTYIPIAAENPNEKVSELIEHLAQYDVSIDVGYLSTTVIGKPEVVFELIQDAYNTMTLEGEKFRFHIELLSPEK